MAKEKKDVNYKTDHLNTIGELILNNKKHSDVTFVVNKKHYYASKIIMSASSEVFKQLITNYKDSDIILEGIQYNESFFNILKYIHGVEINLTTMSKVVLCEMLKLSERYKLMKMHKDFKCYISKIKRFKMNSVVTMMNTAKKYELTELYRRLKIYVFLHAEDVIKHESFVNFQFDVLEDLLKSDWLYAKEIDILRSALNWHDENIMDVPIEENTEAEEDVDKFKDDDDDDDDIESAIDESWDDSSVDLIKEFLSNYSEELIDIDENENTKKKDNFELTVNKTSHEIDKTNEVDIKLNDENNLSNQDSNKELDKINQNIKINDAPNDREVKKSEQEIVETFSKNILRMLLNEIRFIRIPMLEFNNVINIKPFSKYKDFILDQGTNPNLKNYERKKHNAVIVKKFTVEGINEDMKPGQRFYSKEKIEIHNITWFIMVDLTTKKSDDTLEDLKYLSVFLKGECSNKKWECYADFQIYLISHNIFCENVDDDDDDDYDDSTQKFSETSQDWGWSEFIDFSDLLDQDNEYVLGDTITFEVYFTSMIPKIPCQVCNA